MRDAPTTRDRLVLNAARLFQQRGYHGVGLAEILAVSGAPKGSLYHHFPNGKSDLALAAADWAGAELRRVMDDAFRDAADFDVGATTLCFKLAKLFDLSGHRDGCPVSSTLFEGQADDVFRAHAAEIFEGWITTVATHAARFGQDAAAARGAAERLFMALEGAWVLARAQKSADPLRRLPTLLGHAPAPQPDP